ncbi:hypothetical protein [Ruminococcus sp. NK3A76]|uniref:hypothetical protein n=1 Tax=Ruminococcus sp. NK3A76 TaxID=877411 RepID=UPI00048FCD11|nr:hypothetical protein [Ruminococcus sp. NK3A76]
MNKKEQKIATVLSFIPFLFGVSLCKTATGGFYGNDRDLIGYPICYVSGLGIIFLRYFFLVSQLEDDDITELSRRTIMTDTIISNIILCIFGSWWFMLVNGNAYLSVLFCFLLLLCYNIPLAKIRKDLMIGLGCLSAVMLLLCYVICLNIDM